MQFIQTDDEAIARKLKANGYTLVAQEGKIQTFQNDGRMHFSAEEKKRVVFTNKMMV